MYEATALQEAFIVKKVVTVHYFEYSKTFVFSGEQHDFWELVYVDRGEVDIYAGEKKYRLSHGEVIFHKPNEWHNVKATGEVAPNLVIISFFCKSREMNFFKDKILKIATAEKNLLAVIIKEAGHAFSSPLGDPFTQRLERNAAPAPLGSEQLIKISLEQLFISLFRTYHLQKNNQSVLNERLEKDIVDIAMEYLHENLGRKTKFDDVAKYVTVSGATLKKAFKRKAGMGVMAYFARLKIERAKLFIREDSYNFTQISQMLCYESPQHFTKQFKDITRMTPTEYAMSVKAGG
jgi:AraC-type DNA-binding domain-containing proteins